MGRPVSVKGARLIYKAKGNARVPRCALGCPASKPAFMVSKFQIDSRFNFKT